jgi:GTP cyclohydrolase II
MIRAVVASGAAATSIRTVVRIPVTLDDGRTVEARFVTFDGLSDGREHFALQFGNPAGDAPLVRLHSECITGDVFGSGRCDCGPQLREAMSRLHEEGGYLLYLRQEGRGIGLVAKLDAYRLQDQGLDTYAANRQLGYEDDQREYWVAADMLRALEIDHIALLSNNPDKRFQLEAAGIAVKEQVPTGVFSSAVNRHYLEAKVRHTGHTIELPGLRSPPPADAAHSALRLHPFLTSKSSAFEAYP